MRRLKTAFALFALSGSLVPLASAALEAPVVLAAGVADEIEVEPIKCWWKADTSAILVGERFHVTLTCGVIETPTTRTTPNRDALEPAALPVTPFEVVSGVRQEDIVSPPWRYFQYVYDVRLLGSEFFGQDIDLPSIDVTYNLVSKSTETEARERRYRLPALPLRVLSIVPKKAADISGGTEEDSFAAIDARRFRANGELVVAAVSSGFALLFLGLAGARAFGRFRRRPAMSARPLAPAGALGGCVRAVAQIRKEAEDGWTPERVARALAALRVAAAVASGRTVAQEVVERDTTPREGQVALRTGLVRRRSLVVSAAARADGASGRADEGRRGQHQALADPIFEALRAFTGARYGRAGTDGSSLGSSLNEAARAMRALRFRSLWLGRRHRPPGRAGDAR
jgi:hypothetical protein